MRINISYSVSLTFEQFKEQFQKHFSIANPAKKEAEMKKAWEKAEARLKPKEEVAVEQPVKIEAAIAEDKLIANAPEETSVGEEGPSRRNRNR